MRATTLFKTYQSALFYRRSAMLRRGTMMGIAVHNDEEALIWQRYNRLICKLEQRLTVILEQVDGDREEQTP